MFHNLRRTFLFLKGHISKYVAGIVGMALMKSSAALFQSYMLKQILNVGEKQDIHTIFAMLLMFLLFLIMILYLLPIFHFWFNGQAKYGFGNVNKALYYKLYNLPVNYFEQNHSGKLLSYFLNDSWLVASIFMRCFKRVLSAVILIIIYLIPMMVLDYRLGSLIVGINVISMLVNAKVSIILKHKHKEIQKYNAKNMIEMSTIINEMAVIRVYGLQEEILENFKTRIKETASMEKRKVKIISALFSYNYAMRMVCMGIYLIAGMNLVKMGLSTYGNIFAIWSLQKAMDGSFGEIGEYFPELIMNLASTERVYEFLEEEEERMKNNFISNNKAEEYIEFRNVDFAYDSSCVLKNFNMKIKRGEHVALVGESGCGKSSIAKLLLGFYQICGGSIFVDGKSISDISLEKLRSKFAYVPQEPALFHTTIRENIRYGNCKATEEDIIQVAKLAYAYDFIVNLENGFDTLVGEQGCNLSGGQRQRIVLARALLKNAEILILDEATAALDNESEQYIINSLKRLKNKKTVITIAHRDKTIEGADRVIQIYKHN